MEHVCIKEESIKKLEIRLAVAESDIKTVKDDIKDMKSDTKTNKNYAIATLVTLVISLVGVVFMLATK